MNKQEKFKQAIKALVDLVGDLTEKVEVNPEDKDYNELIRSMQAGVDEYIRVKKNSERIF